MLTLSNLRPYHHLLRRRLPLPLPLPHRLALAAVGHQQQLTDQKCLRRSILDLFCSSSDGTPQPPANGLLPMRQLQELLGQQSGGDRARESTAVCAAGRFRPKKQIPVRRKP